MNILVFSWRDPKHPLSGGAEQVMHEHMKGWVKSGDDVTLFSSHFEGCKRFETIDGVRVIRRGFQYLGVHILAFLWYLFGDHQKFDLVVDQFHGIPFFTPLYVRVPKLVVLQEIAREVWFLNQWPRPLGWVVGWIGYIFEPFFFLLYKGVPFMVGSMSAKDDLIRFGISGTNITVVPHGVIVPESKGKNNQKSKIKTVVFLGVLTRDKGIEEAIKAFSILNKKGDYNFWIVGKGSQEYTVYLKGLVRSLSIEKNVHFFGFVSQEKKFELLARAHVLVNSSVREGWGLVNIEANSMGTPVVAYSSPGLVDSVKDGVSGVLCKENTPQALAQEVFSLLTNSKRLDNIRRTAVLWSKRFSWEKSKKQSLKLIESLV